MLIKALQFSTMILYQKAIRTVSKLLSHADSAATQEVPGAHQEFSRKKRIKSAKGTSLIREKKRKYFHTLGLIPI